MIIEQIRNELLLNLKANKKSDEIEYRNGYIDGVLDMFNETSKSVTKELINAKV